MAGGGAGGVLALDPALGGGSGTIEGHATSMPLGISGEFGRVGRVARRTAAGRPLGYSGSRLLSGATMRITLHCLDCGFRFSITLLPHDDRAAVTGSLSCGQCGCRRWSEG